MRKVVFGLIFTLLLLACANTQTYDNKLKQWVGQSEASLISAWGRPSMRQYINANESVITYTRVQDWYMPSEYYFYNDGWGEENVLLDPIMGEAQMGPEAIITDNQVQEVCQTKFWIKDGIITSWQWRGNGCR